MVDICFYFQVHQPFRMRHYNIFDIGKKEDYFDDAKNKEIAQKVANKCYRPTNQMLLELLEQNPQFKISFSITGTALDQFEQYTPDVIESFKKLAATGRCEFIGETYYHSLSFLYSRSEFLEQVQMHRDKMKSLFGVEPTIFRNTELIYNNELASAIEELGYKAIITEGTEKILGWRSPNYVYHPKNCGKLKLLLKNYKLSDDIAFRFSNREWKEWPLTADKYANWVNAINGNGNCLNLFMDYETFGEHQWEDTGIFDFMRHMIPKVLEHPDNTFVTPSELSLQDAFDEVDVPFTISWADLERDVSAWLGNTMQQSSIAKLYAFETQIKRSADPKLIDAWRKLTTSDHFYYMCTKWFSDGDVHKYFSPYESPYDAFISFMNILHDLKLRLGKHEEKLVVSSEGKVVS